MGMEAVVVIFDMEANDKIPTPDCALQICMQAFNETLEPLTDEKGGHRSFTSDVKIQTDLNVAACKVNNWTVGRNNGAPNKWDVVGQEVNDFLRGLQKAYPDQPIILIAHKGKGYDAMLLFVENRANKIVLPNGIWVVDSLEVTRSIFNGSSVVKSHKLVDLYQHIIGEALPNAHDAKGDVDGLHKILKELMTPRPDGKLTSLACIFNDKAAVSLYDLFLSYEKEETAYKSGDLSSLKKYVHLHDAMFFICEEEKVKHVLNKTKGCFGSSFTSNGEVVTFHAESRSSHEKGARSSRYASDQKNIGLIIARGLEMIKDQVHADGVTAPASEAESSSSSSGGSKFKNKPSNERKKDQKLFAAGRGREERTKKAEEDEVSALDVVSAEVKEVAESRIENSGKLAKQLSVLEKGGATIVAFDMGVRNPMSRANVCPRCPEAGTPFYKGEKQDDRSTLQYITDKSLTTVISSKSIINASGAPQKDARSS
jgi:hypothetical protein